MIRLRRSGVKAHADWKKNVDAALPNAAAFWQKARAFEKLPEQGAKRKKGFSAYAPGVLPKNAKGEPDFPAVWRKDERARQAIAGMSQGFCAYCQSAVSSSHPGKGGKKKPPGQIEHFQPKARFPAQAYSWSNYFLVCMACNNAKHDKWPVGGYVRPDRGKPGSKFVFAEDGRVAGRSGDTQAENTAEDFCLSREWLTYHRGIAIKNHLQFVRRLLRHRGIRLEDLLMPEASAFSEAINQNVRRVWAKERGKRR